VFRELTVEKLHFQTAPLTFNTSDRFLWLLVAVQDSFTAAYRLRAPPPRSIATPASTSTTSLGEAPSFQQQQQQQLGVLKKAATQTKKKKRRKKKKKVRWALRVRDLRIATLKLKLNYSKSAQKQQQQQPASTKKKGGSTAVETDKSAAASLSARGGGALGPAPSASSKRSSHSQTEEQANASSSLTPSAKPTSSRRAYPATALGLVLRTLRIGIANATVELQGAALVEWRGSSEALQARLTHHYVTQLKQWTFTLLSAASPSFGSFRLFRSRNGGRSGSRRRKQLKEQTQRVAKNEKGGGQATS